MRKLIPPKGIKRKNQEDYELIDFACPADADEDNFQNLFDNFFNQLEVEEVAAGNISEIEVSSSDENLDEVSAATASQPHELDLETAGNGVGACFD